MFIYFKQQYKIYFESLALFSSVNTKIQFKGERVEKGDGCVEFFFVFLLK